jgi:hypothetical protein
MVKSSVRFQRRTKFHSGSFWQYRIRCCNNPCGLCTGIMYGAREGASGENQRWAMGSGRRLEAVRNKLMGAIQSRHLCRRHCGMTLPCCCPSMSFPADAPEPSLQGYLPLPGWKAHKFDVKCQCSDVQIVQTAENPAGFLDSFLTFQLLPSAI